VGPGARHRYGKCGGTDAALQGVASPPAGGGIRVDAGARAVKTAAVRRFLQEMMTSMSARPPEIFGLDRLETPIGTALLVIDGDGVLRALDWEDYAPRMRELIRLQYGAVSLRDARSPGDLRTALTKYFKGDLDRLDTIKWRVAGTPFQHKVWTALPQIPAGTTMSYGALAAKLEIPRAVRAVGHANGSNPISVVLPCHRLIGANGSLVKYGGGLERKRWLLRHEGVALN
jgi:methylated-DNA-[protein]-cysteine S-methyltransferase